jgi:hypothetical protein
LGRRHDFKENFIWEEAFLSKSVIYAGKACVHDSFVVGNVIKKLQNNEDEDIRKAAKKVYVKWRTHFVEHMERPMIEVKCDLKTEKLRASGTKLLTEALCVQVSLSKVKNHIDINPQHANCDHFLPYSF